MPEKKVKIRPRGLKDREDAPEEVEEEEEELTRIEQVRRTMLRQSGTKFPGRTPTPRDPNKRRHREETEEKKTPPADPEERKPATADIAPAAEPQKTTPPVSEPPNEKQQAVEDTAGEDVWNVPPEKISDPSEAAGRVERKKVVVTGPRWSILWKRFSRLNVPAPFVLGGVVVLIVVSAVLGFRWGAWASSLQAERLATKEKFPIRSEGLAALNTALQHLRDGDPAPALKILQELETTNPEISGLTYLVALAAVQEGNIALSQRKIDETIAKRERISDALALQAVLESQKRNDSSITTMGDPRVRSEEYLRRAMTADAANPYPMIELGTLLRYQKRPDEARELLRGARSRLQPVDSATVVDVSLALMDVEETPTDRLALPADPEKDVTSLFKSAYIALRLGQTDQAVDYLRKVRPRMTIDLFDYLINDPVFRRYVDEPKMKEFFE